jgi:hypothetical protein
VVGIMMHIMMHTRARRTPYAACCCQYELEKSSKLVLYVTLSCSDATGGFGGSVGWFSWWSAAADLKCQGAGCYVGGSS